MSGDGGDGAAVVIPAHQAEATLARAVASVRAQPGPPVRIVICDDGSRDGTGALATALAAGDPLIETLSGPNRGACHARNAGLARVADRGARAVLFLDADDEIAGDLLAPALARVRERADLVLSPVLVRVPGRADVRRDPPEELSARALFGSWLAGDQINPAGLVWRPAFLRAIGGWSEAVRINQDGELAMRAFAAGARVAANRDGYGIYHGGNPDSLSSRHGAETLDNYVSTLTALLETARAADPPLPVEAIGDTLYGVARMCFKAGHPEVGRRAMAILAREGRAHHRGGRLHRLAAGLLGLEAKTRLSAVLSRR